MVDVKADQGLPDPQMLERVQHDFHLLREIFLILESSVDPSELQETILRGLVDEMGYPQASVALYDHKRKALSSWLSLGQSAKEDHQTKSDQHLAHTDTVFLEVDNSLLAQAILDARPIEVLDGRGPTTSSEVNEHLITGSHYLILPLKRQNVIIGIILLDQLPPNRPLSAPERAELDQLARHAGVALGLVNTCIERAQHTAIAEERNRISSELHDNVSQALYGLAYGLDACIQQTESASALQEMLQKLHNTITETQQQVRKTIFDIQSVEISSDTFVAGLHRHLKMVSPYKTIALRVDLPGDFDRWDERIRRNLQQIAQEAVSNTAKHANADQIIVKLSRQQSQIELRVADDGEGFEPGEQEDAELHFGISGMKDRIKSLNGQFEIYSAWGEGTLVIAQVPHPPLKSLAH